MGAYNKGYIGFGGSALTAVLVTACGIPQGEGAQPSPQSGSGIGSLDGGNSNGDGNDDAATSAGTSGSGGMGMGEDDEANDDNGGGGPDSGMPPADSGANDDDTGEGAGPPPVLFDLGTLPDAPDINTCGAPSPVTCDDIDDDPFHALGLNCPGGPEVIGSYTGDPDALHVHEGNLGTFNSPPPFPPREGNKFVILSSGIAQELLVPGVFADTGHPGQDPGFNLPAPVETNSVSATEDCFVNPGLVGTGDCSNTIQAQWSQGSGANDWAELRINVEVPEGTFGFSYDFAMFSTEYPAWYQTQFNDMYIAWLESEQWTGNISFDEMGNPISLNAGFLDYKDAPNTFDCPAPCTAPELQGTAMQGHAGTKWLTTTAGVNPGENIELVLAVFDLSDNALDTVVIIDNFLWDCEGGPPVTIPG